MNWKKMKCCGTCRHWLIDAARNTAGRVRSDIYVDCRAPIVLPISVRKSSLPVIRATPRDVGSDCPLYEPREEGRRNA